MTTQARPSPKKSKTVEFIQELPFIREHVEKGYQAKAIWQCLHQEGKITMTYQMFLNLLKRYFTAPLPAKPLPSQSRQGNNVSSNPSASKSEIAPSRPSSDNVSGNDGVRVLGGFKMDPNRPLKAPVDLPEPFEWNPIALTKDEIRYGKGSKNPEN